MMSFSDSVQRKTLELKPNNTCSYNNDSTVSVPQCLMDITDISEGSYLCAVKRKKSCSSGSRDLLPSPPPPTAPKKTRLAHMKDLAGGHE